MKKLCFLMLAAMLLLCVCQQPMQQTGSLLVQLDIQLSAKTIEPDFDMEPAGFVITGEGPGNKTFEVSTAVRTVEVNNLAYGTWEIEVYARNRDGIIIGESSATVTVHVGTVTDVRTTVIPLKGTGMLDISVLWNKNDTENPSVAAELVPAVMPVMPLNFTVINGDTANYHGNKIPTGYHTLIVKLQDGPVSNKVTTIGMVDVVRIVKDQSSKGIIEFYEINKPGGSIKVMIEADMQNPITVHIAGDLGDAYEGESVSVTASAPEETGNIIYIWYLNGDSVATGLSCTINEPPAGIYHLDVTAFSADGKRAGSAHHLFHVRELDRMHISDFAWSPDGLQIAFIKCESGNYWNNDLWVARKDFSRPRLIAHGINAGGLADWQGNKILFTKDLEEGLPSSYYGSGEFWTIAPDGTIETQVTFTYKNGIRTDFWNLYYNNIGTAVWAKFVPGTGLVYFHAHNGNGWYQTFVCNADGTDNWRNVSSPDRAWRLDVSPTGNKLFFALSSNYNTPMTITSVNPDGSGRFVIKGPLPQCNFLALSGGNFIAWDTGNRIYAIGTDGTAERMVTDDVYINALAGIGRNANDVLICSNRFDGNYHIFRAGIDGGTPAQLTFGSYNDTAPAYSPDGSSLAYLRLPPSYTGTGVPPYELVVKTAE